MGVPSFISFILLIIGPRFKHAFHLSFHSFLLIIGPRFKHAFHLSFHSFICLSIHPFIYYLTTVQTWVPSFISFILLIIGPRFKHVFHLSFSFIHPFIICKHIFHLSFHSFVHWSKICSFIHSFIDLGYPGGTLVATLRLKS